MNNIAVVTLISGQISSISRINEPVLEIMPVRKVTGESDARADAVR